jgi:hypothetical protein
MEASQFLDDTQPYINSCRIAGNLLSVSILIIGFPVIVVINIEWEKTLQTLPGALL